MNETAPHPSHAQLRSFADIPLEARIALAEQAVIARDERIRARGQAIVSRFQGNFLRHAGVGAAAGAGALLLAWLLGRRNDPPPAPPAREESGAEEFMREAGLSLAGVLPLVWPFMPRKVRAALSPGVAGALLTFVAPFAARLFGRHSAPPGRGR